MLNCKTLNNIYGEYANSEWHGNPGDWWIIYKTISLLVARVLAYWVFCWYITFRNSFCQSNLKILPKLSFSLLVKTQIRNYQDWTYTPSYISLGEMKVWPCEYVEHVNQICKLCQNIFKIKIIYKQVNGACFLTQWLDI